MSVYFIRAGVDGPIKVGHAVDPEKRLKELQTGASDTLYLLGWDVGNREQEAMWHTLLRSHHVRGEWFAGEPVIQTLEMMWDCIMPRTEVGMRYRFASDCCEGCDAVTFPKKITDEDRAGLRFQYVCQPCSRVWTCWYSREFATTGVPALGQRRNGNGQPVLPASTS